MKLSGSILQIYDDNVEWYFTHRSRGLMEKKFLDRVIDEIPRGGSLLDLGCGIGEPIASYLASCGLKVTGVDGSANMIAKAKQLQPQGNWIVADMRTLNLNKKFNGILAWDSFFHLTQSDQRKMFDIFKQHLDTEGVLLFTSGPDAGEALGDLNGHVLYHASLSSDEYRNILTEKGFVILDHTINDPTCGGHSVWLARKPR